MQIKQMNRLESTAFYIDTIIHTEKKGDWRRLWQDAQSGLFIVRGQSVGGLGFGQTSRRQRQYRGRQSLISLPPVEILSVDLENIEVYDIQTGSFNLLPVDKAVLQNRAGRSQKASPRQRV